MFLFDSIILFIQHFNLFCVLGKKCNLIKFQLKPCCYIAITNKVTDQPVSSFGYFKSIPHHNNNIDTNKNTRHRPQHKPRHTCSYQSSFFQNVIANSQHTSIFRALSPAHLPISDRPMPPHHATHITTGSGRKSALVEQMTGCFCY